jgi:protein phosphatase 1 regulatory subunit 7
MTDETENDPQPQIIADVDEDNATAAADTSAATDAAAKEEAVNSEETKQQQQQQQNDDSGAPFIIDTAESLKTNGDSTQDNNKGAEKEKEEAAATASNSTEAKQAEEEEQKQVIKKVVPPLPLDWTKMAECNEEEDISPADAIRYPWDVMELPLPPDQSETHLTIVGTAGQKITRMGDNLCEYVSQNLTHLVLRSHLIRTMEGVSKLKHLELLELYDNMIDEITDLSTGELVDNGDEEDDGLPAKNLRVLDISYNVIRDMNPISQCLNLQELYIAQNKIKSIGGIGQLTQLRKVDLGANRIRVMEEEELSGLVNLEELWLGKNKIEHIGGISKLTKLRRLDVQSNRLTSIENLEGQVDTLEELYLAHNGIDVEGAKCPTGLALPFKQLNTIDMSRNRLTDTSPFAHLTSLNELWISGNDIKTFDDVEYIRSLVELDGVYLEYNPVASDFEYRKKLVEIVPNLTQIDATMVGGIGQHGYLTGGGSGENLLERMRQMQDQVIQKAAAETEASGSKEDE